MQIQSKYDYLKLGDRAEVHTNIREDLYLELMMLSKKMKQPCTKLFDVLIKDILEDEEKMNEFKNKVRLYR